MSKENAEKIFRIDAKVKSPGTQGEKGTGLGLILCKDFVEINKGHIWVGSEEGSGSTFHFTIPTSANLT
jgi:signal transduction histidine kinase